MRSNSSTAAKLCVCMALLSVLAACRHRPLVVQEIRGGTLATLRPQEDMRALRDPELLSAEDAAGWMRPDTKVLGFNSGGISVAISLRLLDDHEIVNLSLPSVPDLAATW